MDLFYEKDVVPRLVKYLQQNELSFQENRKEQRGNFLIHFGNICCNLKKRQGESKTDVSYLMFHLLRNRVLQHDYRYQVVCYDRDWYMKDGMVAGEWDAGFFINLMKLCGESYYRNMENI